MTQLLLIRHALPSRAEAGDGPADPDLDPRGHEHAKRLADHLSTETVHAVFASPMRRAVQTAEPLAEALGVDVLIEPDVAECDVIATHYVPAEELKAVGDPRWRDGLSATEWPSYYEPLETFHPRVMAGIDRIVEKHRSQTVAVVCHSAVICRYTSAVLGLPWEQTGFFYPLYTSITRVAASSRGSRMIVTVNETPHLRGTDLPTGALF